MSFHLPPFPPQKLRCNSEAGLVKISWTKPREAKPGGKLLLLLLLLLLFENLLDDLTCYRWICQVPAEH